MSEPGLTPASRKGYVLSCNSGSSSLKISLYLLDTASSEPTLHLTSSITNITAPPALFSFKSASDKLHAQSVKNEQVDSINDHASAFSHFLSVLQREARVDNSKIAQVCHRVVHGGTYSDPVVIRDETYHQIERLSDLAPLHNGAALAVIQSCIAALPDANSIAFFDTAFHQSIPPHIASYAIDQSIAKKRGLRKYGFHGLSYSFILRSTSQFLNKPASSLSLILLHLGSGASVCAVKDGQSFDTSMGLTPVSGLPGATRSGAIDPSLIFHYTNKAGRITHDPQAAANLQVTQAEQILNTNSGWSCLTGTTDFGVITQRAKEGSATDQLAFDLVVDRILSYIGSYYLTLSGNVDAVVFSGGIGEKSADLRRVVGEKLMCLGYNVDAEKNEGVDEVEGIVVEIGSKQQSDRLKKVLVCRTDEQEEMARQCASIEKFWKDE